MGNIVAGLQLSSAGCIEAGVAATWLEWPFDWLASKCHPEESVSNVERALNWAKWFLPAWDGPKEKAAGIGDWDLATSQSVLGQVPFCDREMRSSCEASHRRLSAQCWSVCRLHCGASVRQSPLRHRWMAANHKCRSCCPVGIEGNGSRKFHGHENLESPFAGTDFSGDPPDEEGDKVRSRCCICEVCLNQGLR